MRTHQDYTKGIGTNVLSRKKQELNDYIKCMETVHKPMDEIALVITTHLYNLHVCVLMEDKFWTTNQQHAIGLCSLLIGLTGPLQFTLLKHYTTQIGSNKNQSPAGNTENRHNTNDNGSTSLAEKLLGLTNPQKISEVIKKHAEKCQGPPPPKGQ